MSCSGGAVGAVVGNIEVAGAVLVDCLHCGSGHVITPHGMLKIALASSKAASARRVALRRLIATAIAAAIRSSATTPPAALPMTGPRVGPAALLPTTLQVCFSISDAADIV